MNSLQKSGGSSNEEEDMLLAMQLCGIELIAYGVKTARELHLLEIMAKARPLGIHLSTLYLASKAAPNNPDAPVMIDRLLRLLVAYSVCTCKLVKDENGRESRTYGLGNVGKKSYLTESILEGGASAWEKAKGALVFEYMKENESLKEDFNESMMSHTTIVMNKILENYDGFESLRDSTLVDVGGGIGTNLGQALSKFPRLKGINFDLPHIVSKAPQIHGVEHIGGDMFDEIPRGQAILMKWILHDWSDEKCVEILRNCKKAIPETGRLIVIETIVPREVNNTDIATKNALHSDVGMITLCTRICGVNLNEIFRLLLSLSGESLHASPQVLSATLGEASTEWPALSSKYIGCKKYHKEVVRKSLIASKYATPPVVTLFPTDKDEFGNNEPASSYYSRFHRCLVPPGGLVYAVLNRLWAPWTSSESLSLLEISTIPLWVTLKNILSQLYSILGIEWIASGSSNEEEDMLLAMHLGGIDLIAYAVKTATELDLFEIMAKARPLGTHLSTLDLASKTAPNNPDASVMIDRLLRLLVAYSVCTCKLVKDEKGRESRTYGLGKVGKKFTKDENGVSIASYLTESILEGGASAWERANGAFLFEYMKKTESVKEDFNESMMSHTTIVMKKIFENYDGFE
ncbi:hypothetical protein IGI04_001990, partial [Brassica rapa subsp. trilocularis]